MAETYYRNLSSITNVRHFKLWIFHFSFSLQLSPSFHCSFNNDFRLNLLPDPFLFSGDKGYRSNPYCSSSNILTWKTLYITSFYVCAVTSYHLAFSGILLISHFFSIIPSITSSSFPSIVEHDQSNPSSHP